MYVQLSHLLLFAHVSMRCRTRQIRIVQQPTINFVFSTQLDNYSFPLLEKSNTQPCWGVVDMALRIWSSCVLTRSRQCECVYIMTILL